MKFRILYKERDFSLLRGFSAYATFSCSPLSAGKNLIRRFDTLIIAGFTLLVVACGEKAEVKLINEAGTAVSCLIQIPGPRNADPNTSRNVLSETIMTNESFNRVGDHGGPAGISCSKLGSDTDIIKVQVEIGGRVKGQSQTNLPVGTACATAGSSTVPTQDGVPTTLTMKCVKAAGT